MMLSGIGATGVILIILIALLLFGPNKLPELGRAFGRTLREFRNGAKDIISDDEPKRKEIKSDEALVEQPKNDASPNDRRLPE